MNKNHLAKKKKSITSQKETTSKIKKTKSFLIKHVQQTQEETKKVQQVSTQITEYTQKEQEASRKAQQALQEGNNVAATTATHEAEEFLQQLRQSYLLAQELQNKIRRNLKTTTKTFRIVEEETQMLREQKTSCEQAKTVEEEASKTETTSIEPSVEPSATTTPNEARELEMLRRTAQKENRKTEEADKEKQARIAREIRKEEEETRKKEVIHKAAETYVSRKAHRAAAARKTAEKDAAGVRGAMEQGTDLRIIWLS